jgi:alpha-2-macroglobulin
LIVEILSYIETDKNKLENYYDQMVETLNSSSWTSTQTKGFAFIAAFKYFGKALGLVGKIDYTITGLSGATKTYQHSAYEPRLIIIDKASYDKTISIQNKGKGKLYVYQTNRFIDNNLNKDAAASNLGITVDYYNITMKQSGIAGIRLGDDISVTIRVKNPSALGVNDLALNLKMPAGWELINPRIYETTVAKSNENYTYQDFRDDRVYTFFNLNAGGTETFSFKTKAAFSGDFYLPAVSCEHMYKGTVYARNATRRVSITK